MSDWQPESYLAFADERTRPARDLLAQVPLASAGVVYDLGCGPDNLAEPSHRLMPEVAAAGPWSAKLKIASTARDALPSPEVYYRHLKPHFTRLEIWHTVYNHALAGASGIVEWVTSTGLRPYLDPLDAGERVQYLAAYEARIATAYPAMADGTVLLRFPRLFIAGTR